MGLRMSSDSTEAPRLPDGLVAFVSVDCATCNMIVPVLQQLARSSGGLTVFTQDDPDFPPNVRPHLDSTLEISYAHHVETVPTIMKVDSGRVTERMEGWHRGDWERFTGVAELGQGLPDYRPGCGSRTLEPGIFESLVDRYGSPRLTVRRLQLAELEDELEVCFERGWTDGLPVVPPTPSRVLRMLDGTKRDPQEVLGVVAPDMAEVTVEKVAVNAVMAGCRSEYMPVVLAAVEAAISDEYHLHGLLATSHSAGPVIVVNGPISKEIGMNSGPNVLGQGNRANAAIGRTLQLVVRNVGGGRPGGVDRATLGNPGKFTFCFAENEDDSPWEPLSVERGLAKGISAVTLLAGEGPRLMRDETSRTPESLARTFAACMRTSNHPKQGYIEPTSDDKFTPEGTNWCAWAFDALVVIAPDHARTFKSAGWTKQKLREFIMAELTIPGTEMIQGANGMEEGLPVSMADRMIPKFRPDGVNFVHAGAKAGFFSAVINSRVCGPAGTEVVTKEIGR